MTKTITTKVQQKKKFLLILPLFVIPFLCAVFYALGGGKANRPAGAEKGAGMGFNMELPPAIFDKKEELMTKMDYYKKADEDSVRRRELYQQDPYHRRGLNTTSPTASSSMPASLMSSRPAMDMQADVLLKKLDLLKKQIDAPVRPRSVIPVKEPRQVHYTSTVVPGFPKRVADTSVADPELDRLSELLDKIGRLQQAAEPVGSPRNEERAELVKEKTVEQSPAMAVPAVVEADQELVNGATLALKLTADVVFNGVSIPQGQLVYGIVSINNDRMQVTIHTIRYGQSILTAGWQVYDMDGLQGIHIPEGLGRQVARQSAEQSIGSLNLAGYDPSIGGQMAGAGIQAARNLFSRKVRMIRVMVPAGYRVLLRDTRTGSGSGTLRVVVDSGVEVIEPPAFDSLTPFLHKSASEGKLHLTLRGIFPRDGLLWLYLEVGNSGVFDFIPDKVQLTVQQGKRFRRMAIQEVPVPLCYDSLPSVVRSGCAQAVLVGVKPFELAKDKKLEIQLAEKSGGRMLSLVLSGKTWNKIN